MKKDLLSRSRIKRLYFKKESNNLFDSAWRQYIIWLHGSINNPETDDDIRNWIDKIISEKVNNPKSKYYIIG